MGLIDNLISYVQQENLSSDKQKLFDSFLKKGFPTIKDEEWKYTSLKKIVAQDYCLKKRSASLNVSVIENHELGMKNKIIFLDGNLIHSPKLSGMSISNFSEFQCKKDDAFSKLNESLANNGFVVRVNKNTVIEDPVEILLLNSSKNSFFQYRNQIILEENAEIKFVETIKDLSNSSTLTNNFTQIICEKNTKLEYNKIQNNSNGAKLIDRMNIFQKQDSTCDINTLIFGGGFIRNDLSFEQNGHNCESNMHGISLLNGNQLADNHTFVDHKVPNCRSNEIYKGIYLDNSKGVFNGKIMVRKNAQKIDAFQSNNNILLSDKSTIDSKPQLEIYADDVKCSHGCTIGQLDEDALFYMKSRGIGKDLAKAILTYAFSSEVIQKISIPEVKDFTKQLLAKKLNVDFDFSL